MKKIFTSLFAACVTLSLSAQGQAVSNWNYEYVQSETQGLYRNLEDTITGKPVMKLRKGDRVLVVEKMGKWAVVRVGSKLDFYTTLGTLGLTQPKIEMPVLPDAPVREITLDDLDPKKRNRIKRNE